MPTISVNVPEKMRKKIDELAEENMYSNTSEYIRAALRKQIKEDNGLTPEEEEIVLERLERMDERDNSGKTLQEVSEDLGIE
jgi:Arc/MetJ-type ribon-helix-helix transcriptional regulator